MAWEANETIRPAIEIRDGVIRNPRILSFQHRSPDYPHHRIADQATTDPDKVSDSTGPLNQ
jgi:hypothetical protein